MAHRLMASAHRNSVLDIRPTRPPIVIAMSPHTIDPTADKNITRLTTPRQPDSSNGSDSHRSTQVADESADVTAGR